MQIAVRPAVVILFLLLHCVSYGQQIEFISEDLVFSIDSVCFSVNGDYCFRNPSNTELTRRIYYPVPGHNVEKPFDSILVYDGSQPLDVEIEDSVATFNLTLSPFSEKCIRIYYRQRHHGNMARYILTTTKHWGKPIERADFSLIVKNYISIHTMSMPPDTETEFSDVRIYTWKRFNFMPEEDFIFRFLPGHN